MTPNAQQAFDRLLALLHLTLKTGVKSNRTQIAILRALSPQELTEVAMALENMGDENPLRSTPHYDALSGTVR